MKSIARSPLDTRNNGVGVRSLLGALIPLLDDNHLLPCLSARENDGDFSGLVDCERSAGAGNWSGWPEAARRTARVCAETVEPGRMDGDGTRLDAGGR